MNRPRPRSRSARSESRRIWNAIRGWRRRRRGKEGGYRGRGREGSYGRNEKHAEGREGGGGRNRRPATAAAANALFRDPDTRPLRMRAMDAYMHACIGKGRDMIAAAPARRDCTPSLDSWLLGSWLYSLMKLRPTIVGGAREGQVQQDPIR